MTTCCTDEACLSPEGTNSDDEHVDMLERLYKHINAIERLEKLKVDTAEELDRVWAKKKFITERINRLYSIAEHEGLDPEAIMVAVLRRTATAAGCEHADDYLSCPDCLLNDYEAALGLN